MSHSEFLWQGNHAIRHPGQLPRSSRASVLPTYQNWHVGWRRILVQSAFYIVSRNRPKPHEEAWLSAKQGFLPCNHPIKEQRIDVYEAIELFTINGAKIGFEEDLKGSIELGKLADFAVLSDDPYRVPREKIGNIKVEMTIVRGKVVYQS